MKQLICEMCGSTELLKQDGVFVCQSCGTKYSVEEAKKMMVEGIVEVTGAVRIDNSALHEKNLINARNAFERGEWEDVKKYYELVKNECPDNQEAIIFCSMVNVKRDLLDNDKSHDKREKVFKQFENCLQKLKTLSYDKDHPENIALIKSVSKGIMDLMETEFVVYSREITPMGGGRSYTDTGTTTSLAHSLLVDLSASFCALLQTISIRQDHILFHELIVEQCQLILELRYTSTFLVGWSMLDGSPKIEIQETPTRDEKLALQQTISSESTLIEKFKKQERKDKYWAVHIAEKQQYEARLAEIESELKELSKQDAPYLRRIEEIKKSLPRSIPEEGRLEELRKRQNDLHDQKSKLGLFAGKQKKELSARICSLQAEIDDVSAVIKERREELQQDMLMKFSAVETERKPITERVLVLNTERSKINEELTKER